MKDAHVRVVIEFDIDQKALWEHGLKAVDVLKNLKFVEDNISDGFRIGTAVPGFDPTSNFFLCDGKLVSSNFILGRSHGDALDDWREMVREELHINGCTIHGLSEEMVNKLISSDYVVDALARRIETNIVDGDMTEYAALDKVFEEDFMSILASFDFHNFNNEKPSLSEQIKGAQGRRANREVRQQQRNTESQEL